MLTLFVALRALFFGACFFWLWRWVALSLHRNDREQCRSLPDWTLWPGWVMLVAGSVLALACIGAFVLRGRGTPAPFDAPVRFVAVGPYRWVRNPMYIGVLTLLFGWSIASGSRWLAIYAGALAIMFHLRVVLGEEPWLERQYGADWTAYAASVHRWLPRFRGR